MSWWGKALGGVFGFALGGPLGALLGAALGHTFDRGLASALEAPEPGLDERAQAAFFTATFSVMGHLAKADGRVSEEEIGMATALMARMRLSPEQRRTAERLFREGKSPEFRLEPVLAQLREECRRSRNLLRMFLEIQIQAAYADRRLHPAERGVLARVAEQLGIAPIELDRLERLVRFALHMQEWFRSAGAEGPPRPSPPPLADAYAVLGVDESASDAEVQRAYRRLMSQHHPDKLVARGLPEEMTEIAKARTQEIGAAYERVKSARRARRP